MNHYYYHAWQLFWIGNLAMFTLPAILYIASTATDNVEVKFVFKYFCQTERFYAFIVQGIALTYFVFGPTMGVATKATSEMEMWIVMGVQIVMFFWYQYVFMAHDSKLDAWYFAEVAKSRLSEQPPVEEDEEDLGELSSMGGEALEF